MTSLAQTDASFALRFFDAGNQLAAVRAVKAVMLEQLTLHRGLEVLEVGCGAGEDVLAIARRVGVDGRAIGVDASPLIVAEATRRARGRNVPAEFHVGDALALDLPDGCVDRCKAERLLMHVEGDPALAVGEMARVLRPGGRLVVFDFDWDALVIDGAEHDLTQRIVRSYCDAVSNGRVGRALPRLLRDAGLADVTVIPHAVEMPYDFFGWVLSGHLDAALAAGHFTPQELIAWWDQLDAASERERFFSALLGFVVTGTKPL
jgi:ubiquinone/menaquinone biosynthesis C-methylase UbiE